MIKTTNNTKALPLTSNLSIEQIFDYCDINVQGIDKEELIALVMDKVDERYEEGKSDGYNEGIDDGYKEGYDEGYNIAIVTGKQEQSILPNQFLVR